MKLKPKTKPMVEEKTLPEGFELISIKPTTLDFLIRRAYEIEGDCHDYLVPEANSNNVLFNEQAGLTFTNNTGKTYRYGISRYALGQLGSKLGVPVRYLDKCIETGRMELAQDNVNSWLSDFNKDLFLREYQGKIRGVLSSKYSVCDSHEILEATKEYVDLRQYKVKGSFLNEERLHLRLVSTQMLPIEGEDLFAGLFIDSSDIGRSVLTVQFGIYKQVCTNGLIVSHAGGTLFSQKHIGITAEEFRSNLADSLYSVDELVAHAVDWVKLAREKKCWGYNANKLSEDDMKEFIHRIRSRTLLPEEGAKKVIDLMQTKYDSTWWGLINGITEAAQDYTLERRLGLERIAGNLLVA